MCIRDRLQDQFKQAVSTAMASESMMADAAARATDTAVKFATAASGTPATGKAGAEGTKNATTATADKPAAKPAPKKAPAKPAPAKAGKAGTEKP